MESIPQSWFAAKKKRRKEFLDQHMKQGKFRKTKTISQDLPYYLFWRTQELHECPIHLLHN